MAQLNINLAPEFQNNVEKLMRLRASPRSRRQEAVQRGRPETHGSLKFPEDPNAKLITEDDL